jgi:ABC-type multidrug transport system fused ATPase/permease subunit
MSSAAAPKLLAAPVPTLSMRERLTALLGDRMKLVVALGVSSILSGFAEAGVLAIVARVATDLVERDRRLHLNIGPLDVHATVGGLIGVAFVLTLIRLLLQIPISVLPARIASDVQASLRKRLFHAFTRASWGVQSSDREGHLQETMTSQVMQATSGALQATTLVTALFTFSVLMISSFLLNVAAAIVVLAAAIVLFGVLRPLNRLGVRRSRALSQAQVEYAGGVGETIRTAEETHVFGVAGAQRERIDGLVDRARELFFRSQLVGRLTPSLYQSMIYVVLVAGLWVLHSAGSGHIASLGAVVLLLVRAGSYGQQVQSNFQGLQQSLPFIERLLDAERRYREGTPVSGDRPLADVRTLAYEHVSFAYRPERPVLSDISFEVSRGEAVGVIGPSGAGKSTFVQILLQLRPPVSGRYLVNGEPAQGFDPADWHRLVAYVPQEPRLVHASVADNIRYFRDIELDAVEHAARLAGIHEEIVGWSHGYDTIVGPRADAVSGGQQQRICLARALAAKPEVLVLDEPTSALDPHSEALIGESLKALRRDLTMFVVAHRMSTLDMCDRVMVILDGKLAAFDTAALLSETNPYYRSASTLAAGASGGRLP